MGKIFCLIGKSASGKDTIYHKILSDESLHLKTNVMYTTRPIREKEKEGVDYHFVYGDWTYFTLSDDFDLEQSDYLLVNTLEGYLLLKQYFEEEVIPIYIYLSDIIRLQRAVARETLEKNPKCSELCRRFLADEQDFSPENLENAHIPNNHYFENIDLEECTDQIKQKIKEYQKSYVKKKS